MKLKKLMISGLALCLVGCNSGSNTYVIESTAPYGLAGMTGKKTYTGLTSTPITQWNYLGTSEAADATHFANFVDGLILHNEFGVLEKNLAEKVVKSEDNKEFTFTIREGVKWVTYSGNQYVANGEKQYVAPSDWVTTAKYVCTYSNSSPLLNFYMIFIKGAVEYYFYSYIKYMAGQGNSKYTKILDDNKKCASTINSLIEDNYPSVYTTAGYDTNPVKADDVPNIANFTRVGVVADDANRTLKYQLFTNAFYFPTVLTYSAFLPTNASFLASVGSKSFGTDKDKILYCGPYLNSYYDDVKIEYTRNKSYWNPDIVHLDKVTYNILPSTVKNTYVYMREQYEAGNIDGFSLNAQDETGWRKYILGADGTGTRENPADGSVNARFLDTIGNMYGSNINVSRYTNGNKKSYAGGTESDILNTENALSLNDVRQAVLNALDYDTFNLRYSNGEEDYDLMNQYMVNSYVPQNFVQDDDGHDYVTYHYYKTYAEHKGIEVGDVDNPTEGTAAYILKAGQYAGRSKTDEEVAALALQAAKAIKLYNDLEDKETADISFPIRIEYYSSWFDENEQEYDAASIRRMNERLNAQEALDYLGVSELFKVVPTTEVTSTNYSAVSGSDGSGAAFDYAPVLWGWGADYGDPLTYMATYQKHGDWKDIFGYIDADYVTNYNTVDGSLVKTDLLADYTTAVNNAMVITDDVNERYAQFAECEYTLINELGIYMPQVNYGQGWSISVSRSAGYAMPSSNYGLADDRMTGLWVLIEALSGEERTAMRAKFQEAKEAYTSSHPAINIY